ncbi:MAG: glycerophosphodiester phosphodiesterase [Promethearchaeia archaeon]
MTSKTKTKNTIKISGHRAFKGEEIENTRKAVQRAIRNQIDYIEVDIRKTRDNHLILFHDKWINRLLNGWGKVKSHTLKELKSYTYADGQSILTLAELFSLVKDQIGIILDVKSKSIDRDLIELIDKYNMSSSIIVQSKFGKIINKCYKLAPNLDYALYRVYIGKIGLLGRIFKIQRKVAQVFYNIFIKPYPIEYISLDGPFMYKEILDILNENKIKIILGALKVSYFLDRIERWHVSIINANDPVSIRKCLKRESKRV